MPIPAGEVTGEIMAHFVQAIRGEVQMHCGLDVGMHLAEQTMGAYESAKTGAAVDLHTTFTPWWGKEADGMTLSGGWF